LIIYLSMIWREFSCNSKWTFFCSYSSTARLLDNTAKWPLLPQGFRCSSLAGRRREGGLSFNI